jgi:tRNA(Ile)-lysidine synthase
MEVKLEPGKYVVAVSGGVDSIVLFDVLNKLPDLELVLAHFDHGMRKDSAEDRKFAEQLAKNYDVLFEYAEGKLGAKTSEADARQARYNFLYKVRERYQALGIVTAHHQDDLLETAILNWLRGTNRKGLSSLQSTDIIKRPLLHIPKKELLAYAQTHNLVWREDPSNQDEKYLRNYVRRQIVSRLTPDERTKLLDIIKQATISNRAIDLGIKQVLGTEERLDRQWFIKLSHSVAKEVMAAWLRQHEVRNLDRHNLERLVIAAKTYSSVKQTDIDKTYNLKVSSKYLALEPRDR